MIGEMPHLGIDVDAQAKEVYERVKEIRNGERNRGPIFRLESEILRTGVVSESSGFYPARKAALVSSRYLRSSS
jgi:hypothetical protein